MPYLTPETVPDTRTCRALLIPESSEWLALFSGALTELSLKYNWQQAGISIEETLAVINDVLAGYYDGCVASGCNQPDGYGVLRINAAGHVEQLIDGEWVEPQGENAFPPVPSRSEATPEERKCLAAANLVRVLEVAYEEISEAFAEGLTTAQAITRFIAALATYFFWIAPIVNGLVLLLAGFFELVYGWLYYVSADVWDTDFNDALTCIMYECATDTGDVVTFDYNCIMQKLVNINITPPWNEPRARLAAQLSYLIPIAGGVDFMNQAGGTTSVLSHDCDDCEQRWCYIVNFTESEGGFIPSDDCGTVGNWVAMSGWNVVNAPACAGFDRTLLNIQLLFDDTTQVDTIDVHYDYFGGTFTAGVQAVELYINNFATRLYVEDQNVAREGFDLSINLAASPDPYDVDSIELFIQPAVGTFGGTGRVVSMQLTGTGTKPEFLEALGWEPC